MPRKKNGEGKGNGAVAEPEGLGDRGVAKAVEETFAGGAGEHTLTDPTTKDMGYDEVGRTSTPEKKSGRRTKPERPESMKSGPEVPPAPDDFWADDDTFYSIEQLHMECQPPRYMSVRIVGLYPLLFNRPNEETIEGIIKKQKGEARDKKAPRNPDKEFCLACHVIKGRYSMEAMATNTFGCPAIAVKKAMLRASFNQGDEKNMKSNLGSFFVHGPYGGLLEINCPPPTLRRDVVVVRPAGTLTPCYRPEFWPWEIDLILKFWPNLVTHQELLKWLQLAGQHGGIGSRRISNSGEQFGGFDVTDWRALPKDFSPTYHRNSDAKEPRPARKAKEEAKDAPGAEAPAEATAEATE
jgi:hypothetical protein